MNPETMRRLNRANELRIERAQIKQRITTPNDAAEIVRTCTNGMFVSHVLDAMKGWGLNRVEALMTECALPYYATLGGERAGVQIPITDRQRNELATLLEAM